MNAIVNKTKQKIKEDDQQRCENHFNAKIQTFFYIKIHQLSRIHLCINLSINLFLHCSGEEMVLFCEDISYY